MKSVILICKSLFTKKMQLLNMLFFFVMMSSHAQDPFVSGPDSVCFSGTYTFFVENSDPTISYDWQSSFFGFGLSPFNFNVVSETATTIEIDIYAVGGLGDATIRLCAFQEGTSNNNALCKTCLFLDTPQDMLVFPTDVCDDSDSELPYDLRYIDRYVCLGDTMHVGVAYYQRTTHETILPTEIFTPDRLVLLNGDLIAYDDYNFTVVWDQVGSEDIRLKTTNDLGCFSTLTADVIVRDTSAIEVVVDGLLVDTFTTCVNSNVHLEADVNITADLKWQLSDGRVFSTTQVDVAFEAPGVYLVELYESSECSCYKPAKKVIIVEPGASPQIACTGTTCTGEEVTYHSVDSCGQYIWSVSAGATIVEGGNLNDSYITVIWNSSPEGTIWLSTPDCFEASCRESVDVTIPIIGNNIEIEGEGVVCFSQVSYYEVPFFDGTTYTWNLPSFYGSVVAGQGTNSVAIQWKSRKTEFGPIDISVSFENCFVDCSGQDSHPVEILPPMDIWFNNEPRCKNAIINAVAKYDILPDWQVVSPSGNTVTYPATETLDIIADEVGVYQIEVIAPPSTTCNDVYSFEVVISPDPFPPSSISQSEQVCKDLSIAYAIPGMNPFDVVQWTVRDGNSPATIYKTTAKSLNYTWVTSGPYQISARVVNSQTGCISEATTFNLQNETEIEGLNKVCQGNMGEYYVNISNESSANWSIEPSNAGVITNSTSDSLFVLWTLPGVHEVVADICEVEASFTVVVEADISMVLDGGPTCPEEVFQLTAANTVGLTISIFDNENTLVGTSFPLTLQDGFYSVVAENSAGCQYKEEIEVVTFKEASFRVSSPQPNVYCGSIPFPITLVVNTDGSYAYEWFKNNVSLGLSGNSITTTDFGSYYVEVTDGNGCITVSNTHIIREDCGTADPINFSLVDLDCNNLIFEVDPPFNSSSFTWYFDDEDSGLNNVATGLSVSHEFTYAGYYYVVVVGNQNEAGVEIIEIGTVADFDFQNGCAGDSLFFTNTTTYIAGFEDGNYVWNFDDSGSGADNTSLEAMPVHVFSAPGQYSVTLQSTDINGCVSVVEKVVTVYARPNISILSQTKVCKNLDVSFEPSLYDDGFDYTWDFGEPSSGQNNTVSGFAAAHVFSSSGIFTVSLEVRDAEGCDQRIVQQIEVVENVLSGDISGNLPLPKCPKATIVLTAPSADQYLWSNGEDTQFISVLANGKYVVTLSDDAGCSYVPPPFTVSSIDLSSTEILGKKRQVARGEPGVYRDSIVICQGEPFDLFSNEDLNLNYMWSTLDSDTKLFYEDHFSGLAVGSYDYWLEVDDQISGCGIRHEYKVIINPLPLAPTISKNLPGNCEGTKYTISVDNPQSNLTYRWQDGSIGPSIETTLAGSYFVSAISHNGCIAISDPIEIASVPTNTGWMTGCLEVCFPHQFCLTLNDAFSYTVLKDGDFFSSISSTSSDFTINGPGNYSLVAMSIGGCEVETDYLSLGAVEQQQQISGIVYYDENTNGIFDGNDLLLQEVWVYLMAGSTVLDSLQTDESGSYLFTTFEGANHHVKIDVSGLNYDFEGPTDSLFFFDNCIDEKEMNFPLRTDCYFANNRILQEVCPDAAFTIDGVDYYAGDIDTLRYMINENCDSTVIIEVTEAAEPVVSLDILPTCLGSSDGEVLITILQGTDLRFAIDDSTNMASLTSFDGLLAGAHVLYVNNLLGCNYSFPFAIDQIVAPQLELSTDETCSGAANGVLNIQTVSGSGLSFSLDGVTYGTQQQFSALDTGDYLLSVLDGVGCSYEYNFEIQPYPEPEYSLLVQSACEGQANGTILVEVESQDSLLVALNDASNWSENSTIDQLTPGNYLLYTQTTDGCIDVTPFSIGMIPEPEVMLTTLDACEGQSGGSLEITANSAGLEYSLDGFSYGPESSILDIQSGSYTLFYQTEVGCIYELPFEIIEVSAPEVTITTIPTCLQDANGWIDISIISGVNLEFSVDNQPYQTATILGGLFAGEDSLYVRNELGCTYVFPFEVPNLPAPEITFLTESTCEGEADGKVELTVLVGADLRYSIDNVTYGEETEFANLQDGDYILYVMDTLGCEYEFPFVIDPYEGPEFQLTVMDACENAGVGSVAIQTTNQVTAEFAIDLAQSWSAATSFNDLGVGEYILYSRSEFGCLDSTNFVIEVAPQPDIELVTTPSCELSSAGRLEVLSSDPSLTFSLDGQSFTTDVLYTNLQDGTYVLYYTTTEGCVLEKPFAIPLLAAPEVSIQVRQTCIDESVGGISIAGVGSDNLVFSLDGIAYTAESDFDDLGTGEYTVFVQNDVGCIYTYDATIEEVPHPTFEVNAENSCSGENSGIIEITADDSYQIALDGEIMASSVIDELAIGEYTIRVENEAGCATEQVVSVEEFPQLQLVAPTFELDCYEEEVVIDPRVVSSGDGLEFLWQNGSTESQITAITSGLYAVTISDICSSMTFEWDLGISTNLQEGYFVTPNIFSPNNDGVNECFEISASRQLNMLSYDLMIFDRWGNMIFHTKDSNDCWTGKYNDTELEEGVYVYLLNIGILQCGEPVTENFVGDVTIIR